MLKKFLLAAAAAALMVGTAFGANIPLITGAVDPSNEIQALNNLAQSINTGVNGQLAALPASVSTTLTTITPLFTYTLPGGQLSAVGQGLHIHSWGTNSADANVKTITFTYGAATCATLVTGSGNSWVADWYLIKTGAATQTYECHGQTAGSVAVSAQATATNADSAATTVSVSGTAATAGTITLGGAYVEQLK